MTKGKQINKTVDLPIGPAQPTPTPGKIQVTQGNVSIVAVQLLDSIRTELTKIVALLEELKK